MDAWTEAYRLPDTCRRQHGSSLLPVLQTDMFRQEREEVIQHIDRRPEAMWKINTMWSFRNEAKMYGSPMFDAVWAKMTNDCSDRLPQVVQALQQASVPKQYQKIAS